MSQCMDLIAAMSQPSAECVLRCVSLIALNCFVNLPWSSIAERDSASEGLVSHMREGIALVDLDNAAVQGNA